MSESQPPPFIGIKRGSAHGLLLEKEPPSDSKTGCLTMWQIHACLRLPGCLVFFITDGADSVGPSAIIWVVPTFYLHSLGLGVLPLPVACALRPSPNRP
jgi:hypothetical protein